MTSDFNPNSSLHFNRFKPFALAALCLALVTACGGGGGASDPGTASAGTGGTTGATPLTTATTPITTSPGGALEAAKTCSIANFEQEFVKRTNDLRAGGATCGSQVFPAIKTPVSWNSKLFEAAAAHSKDMIDRNFFDHTNPDGKDPGDRITAQGYAWGMYGENIAAGQRDVQAVMNSWMSSDGHCRNIMNANAQEVALACVAKSDGTRYWTMVLAKPL
jgi:uncharacterized protein YkwD